MDWEPGALESEVMEGPDEARFMQITTAINLINTLGPCLLSLPRVCEVLRGML